MAEECSQVKPEIPWEDEAAARRRTPAAPPPFHQLSCSGTHSGGGHAIRFRGGRRGLHRGILPATRTQQQPGHGAEQRFAGSACQLRTALVGSHSTGQSKHVPSIRLSLLLSRRYQPRLVALGLRGARRHQSLRAPRTSGRRIGVSARNCAETFRSSRRRSHGDGSGGNLCLCCSRDSLGEQRMAGAERLVLNLK
jgi:hypothetical protein